MNQGKSLLRITLLTLVPLLGLAYIVHSNVDRNQIDIESHSFQVEDTTELDNFPALMIKDQKGVSSPIHMSDLKIDVQVIGNIATTTMEMTFYNDEDRILEGELYFPLGEGQTVSRFAMDVEGKLREGVIVEKEKGQQVFESIVRQQIDPGLLEWTKGNNFKARVYPIPAKGHKRILIAYEQELKMINHSNVYLLPLNFKENVDQFDLRVEVFKQEIQPEIEKNSLVTFEFEKWEENFVASYSKKNFLPNKQIGISLPIPQNKQLIYTEKVPGSINSYYFYTTLTPRQSTLEDVELPKTIGLVWDASSSGIDRDVEKELRLLDAYFQLNKNVTVKYISLRNASKFIQSYQVQNGEWSELRSRLKNIPFDGASAYKSINFKKFGCDMYLLMGDGLNNFGTSTGDLGKAVINTVNSSTSANHSYLKYVASSTGGNYVNLLNTELDQAVSYLKGGSFQYYGNGIVDTYPSIPTSMGEQIHVAGIIEGTTEMDFTFGNGSPVAQIHLTIDPQKHLTETGILRRIWAQKKLAELDINYEDNQDEITELGKEYGLVTRNTSLIVLDRIEDYLEHEIIPPAELQQDYFNQLAKKEKDEKDVLKEHLDKVKTEFNAYVEWWKKDIDLQLILSQDKARREQANSADTTIAIDGMIREVTIEENIDRAYYNNATDEAAPVTGAEPELASEMHELDSEEGKKKEDKGRKKASIELSAWEPDAPYMKELKNAPKDKLYTVYLQLKEEHGTTPSFYLDAADFFIEQKEKALALRILSNIAEMQLENHELMRVLAHRLEQLEYYDLAINMYEQVMKIRQEEPQSFRDLGLCLAKNKQYQAAVDMLYNVVEKPWDSRFPGIETIALIEINQINSLHNKKVNLSKIDTEFIKDLPIDVRVILNWDTDNCDMDLWVTDPRGEKCFYSHKETTIGGRMSNDFTRGYGPEMFTIKNAMKGKYKVEVDYYGTSSQKLSGPTTIQIQLVTNYGKPNEKVQEITRRLSTQKEILDIGTLLFE